VQKVKLGFKNSGVGAGEGIEGGDQMQQQPSGREGWLVGRDDVSMM